MMWEILADFPLILVTILVIFVGILIFQHDNRMEKLSQKKRKRRTQHHSAH